MEGGQGQRLVKDLVEDLVVSLGHHQMGGLRMMGWRMGKSDEIGCVEVIDEIGLEYGEEIDGCLDVGNHGDLG